MTCLQSGRQSSFVLILYFLILCFLVLFSCANNRAVYDITMSFGFGVSDFIAVIELANQIRKEFTGAPGQFEAIMNEYAT